VHEPLFILFNQKSQYSIISGMEMLNDLFRDQRRHLDYFFDKVDMAEAEKVVNLCLQTKGLLILTGVGKSGLIAEKIAMTLVSTGTKALYLPPTNFLHGDIGIVSAEDTVIFLSKSGETEELLHLLPFIQKRGATIVALVSNAQGRLAQYAHASLVLPVEQELCPFDLAPTISCEVQLLFGDVLAMALMKKKGFTLASYGDNHPSGTIGKKITLTVEDLMVQGELLPLCKAHHTLQEILEEFSAKRLGCMLVIDDKKQLQGIYTEGDLRRSLQVSGSLVMQKTVGELMTRSPLTTKPQDLAWHALKLMQKNPKQWITALPVIDDGCLVGLIRMHDIVNKGII
jgi:arabinose-5-phosphate isomerase